jgi:hypothetical protein
VERAKCGAKKSPAAIAAGLNFLFFSKEVTAFRKPVQSVSYCYWILIFLFLFLLFFWRLNPVSDRIRYRNAVTLRLGRVLKARAVPTYLAVLPIQ